MAMPTGSEGASQVPLSLMARIQGVLLAPAAVFANLRVYPRIQGALLVIMILSLASYALIAPIINEAQFMQMTEAIEKNENIPEERKAEIIEQQSEMMAKPIMKLLGPVSVLVVIPLFYALGGLLLQLGCNFVLGGQVTFRQAFSGALHVGLPATIVGGLLKTPLIMATRNMHAATSLALLLPDPDPATPIFGLLNTFDIFTIWTAILVVIAAAGLTGFQTSRTRILGILFMIVAAVMGTVGALLQGLGG